jgi:hypothetical protein
VSVGVSVAVFVGVLVGVSVGVLVGVFVGVFVDVLVGVLVDVPVAVLAGVFVRVAVAVIVGVFVMVGVDVYVGVLVLVGVIVAAGHGWVKINLVPETTWPLPPLQTYSVNRLPVSRCTPIVELLAGVLRLPMIISNCCSDESSKKRTSKLTGPLPDLLVARHSRL